MQVITSRRSWAVRELRQGLRPSRAKTQAGRRRGPRRSSAQAPRHGLRPSIRRRQQNIGDPGSPMLHGFGTPAPEARRLVEGILKLDGAETYGGGAEAHCQILRPVGPVDPAGPVPDNGMARMPPRRRTSGRISRECTVAVRGYYCKLCKSGS